MRHELGIDDARKLAISPFSMRSSKNAMSSARSLSQGLERELEQRLCQRRIVAEVGEAISGSIIQNSARCRLVLEFSARKVGPKV